MPCCTQHCAMTSIYLFQYVLEWYQWRLPGVFVVYFEHISHLILLLLLLTLNKYLPAGFCLLILDSNILKSIRCKTNSLMFENILVTLIYTPILRVFSPDFNVTDHQSFAIEVCYLENNAKTSHKDKLLHRRPLDSWWLLYFILKLNLVRISKVVHFEGNGKFKQLFKLFVKNIHIRVKVFCWITF